MALAERQTTAREDGTMDDRYLDPASDLAEAGRGRHLPPDLLDHLEQVVPFIRSSRPGLIVDFDGTISELAPIQPSRLPLLVAWRS